MNIELWNKAIEYHGHKCVGLALGFRLGEEAKKIFGEGTEIHCILPNRSCIMDGISVSIGEPDDEEWITIDPSVEKFVFYVKDDDEGWAFRQKKLDLPEGTDPIAAVLTYARDTILTVEPYDL